MEKTGGFFNIHVDAVYRFISNKVGMAGNGSVYDSGLYTRIYLFKGAKKKMVDYHPVDHWGRNPDRVYTHDF